MRALRRIEEHSSTLDDLVAPQVLLLAGELHLDLVREHSRSRVPHSAAVLITAACAGSCALEK